MIQKLRDYLRKTDVLYPPMLWQEWGVEPQEFSEALAKIWYELPSPIVFENRVYINYTNPCTIYETCNTKYRRGRTLHESKLQTYTTNNQKPDQHVSVFRHDQPWVSNFQSTGTVSCVNTLLSPRYLYLELDRDSVVESINDALKIYYNFPHRDAMRFWYSGNRSIHIEVDMSLFGGLVGRQSMIAGIGRQMYNLAHRVAGDVRHGNGITDIYTMDINDVRGVYYETFDKLPPNDLQKLRSSLENIDPNLYRTNSLIRQDWSYHEKTDKQKILLDIDQMQSCDISLKPKNKLAYYKNNSYLPYMLHWNIECSQPVVRRRESKDFSNAELMIREFSKHIEDFDPAYANDKGFVNDLYSPFYEDSNPSVAVNIRTGRYIDFGEPTHSFDFYDFYAKAYDITREQAIQRIKEEENVDNN